MQIWRLPRLCVGGWEKELGAQMHFSSLSSFSFKVIEQ